MKSALCSVNSLQSGKPSTVVLQPEMLQQCVSRPLCLLSAYRKLSVPYSLASSSSAALHTPPRKHGPKRSGCFGEPDTRVEGMLSAPGGVLGPVGAVGGCLQHPVLAEQRHPRHQTQGSWCVTLSACHGLAPSWVLKVTCIIVKALARVQCWRNTLLLLLRPLQVTSCDLP